MGVKTKYFKKNRVILRQKITKNRLVLGKIVI